MSRHLNALTTDELAGRFLFSQCTIRRFSPAFRLALKSALTPICRIEPDARANAQGELSALERGIHALHSGKDQRTYAAEVNRGESTINKEVQAARVAASVVNVYDNLSDHFIGLTLIHAAPSWLWPSLVHRMTQDGMTVDATRKMVAGVKDAPNPPL